MSLRKGYLEMCLQKGALPLCPLCTHACLLKKQLRWAGTGAHLADLLLFLCNNAPQRTAHWPLGMRRVQVHWPESQSLLSIYRRSGSCHQTSPISDRDNVFAMLFCPVCFFYVLASNPWEGEQSQCWKGRETAAKGWVREDEV